MDQKLDVNAIDDTLKVLQEAILKLDGFCANCYAYIGSNFRPPATTLGKSILRQQNINPDTGHRITCKGA